jgi:hypothetical protein
VILAFRSHLPFQFVLIKNQAVMMKNICVTALCLCLSVLGCGGSTPEPESPQQPQTGDASGDASPDEGSGEAARDDAGATDPETTEEVIETSGPLE